MRRKGGTSWQVIGGCAAAAACVLALLPPVPAAWAETLDDELQTIVETHPNIKSKTKAVKSNEEDVRASSAGYLPTVTAAGDTGSEYVDSPDRRSVQGKPFFKGRETSSLTVTQKLFDGFATAAAVETSEAQKKVAESDLRFARQAALLEGVSAYIDVMKQTRLISLARENERKVQEQLSLEDERVRKGSGMASDVLAAKQRLQVAKERRVNYEGEFQTASSKYNQVFGHSPNVAGMADPPLPLDLLPPTLDEALDIAQKENPTLESTGRKIDVTEGKKRAAEAGYLPTINVTGKADYENDKNAVIGVRRDWSILVGATWELFSGFKTDAQVAKASWEQAGAKDDFLQSNRAVGQQVRIAWHKLSTARQRIDLLDNAATIAEEVLEAQKKKREAGKATVQDVLDEETRLNEARINYATAFYDMYQAAYDLLAAMGRMEVDNLRRGKPAVAPKAMMPPMPHMPAQAAAPLPTAPAVVAPPVPAPVAVAVPEPVSAPALAPVTAASLVEVPPAPPAAALPSAMPADQAAFPAGDVTREMSARGAAASLPDGSANAMIDRVNRLMGPAGGQPAFAPAPPAPATIAPARAAAMTQVSPQDMTSEVRKLMGPVTTQPAFAPPAPTPNATPDAVRPAASPSAMVERVGGRMAQSGSRVQ
ncbi:MAG: TolC family outer membrane protein [Actinomycetota bacterium]